MSKANTREFHIRIGNLEALLVASDTIDLCQWGDVHKWSIGHVNANGGDPETRFFGMRPFDPAIDWATLRWLVERSYDFLAGSMAED